MLLNLSILLIISTLIITNADQYFQSKQSNYLTVNDKLNLKFLFNILNKRLTTDKEQREIQKNNFYCDIDKSVKNRVKREIISQPLWITKDFEDNVDTMKMQALVIRDENIPPCCTTANPISKTRHFMCSGAILTLKHAITSASCIHFADVYEHHVNAELAIFIGAFSSTPYIIKINRFEMHPNYDYNVESSNLSTYNLAILFLNCRFSSSNLIVPRLPRGYYDDIGHLCCSRKCELMTIIQNANNRHVARILPVKYLPSPIHTPFRQMNTISNNSTKHSMKNIKKRMDTVSSLSSAIRRVRKSVGKLAATPSFFQQASSVTTSYGESKIPSKSTKDLQNQRIRNIFDDIAMARRKFSSETKTNESRKRKSEDDDEVLTSIDWKKMEEKFGSNISAINREKMEKFTKKLVDDAIIRLDSVVDLDKKSIKNPTGKNPNNKHKFYGQSGSNLLQKFLPQRSDNKNNTLTDFALAFARILKSVPVPLDNANKLIVSSDLMVEENDLGPPPPKYVDCPPLGTPIFKDGVLIAMIAYTCDDVQNWVEWKYVSISKNMNWIRKRISTETKDDATMQHQSSPIECD